MKAVMGLVAAVTAGAAVADAAVIEMTKSAKKATPSNFLKTMRLLGPDAQASAGSHALKTSAPSSVLRISWPRFNSGSAP